MILLAIALSVSPAVPPKEPQTPVVEYDPPGEVGEVVPQKGDYPAQTTRDDGFGKCPAFQHWHALDPGTDPSLDGKCHSDDTDAPVATECVDGPHADGLCLHKRPKR